MRPSGEQLAPISKLVEQGVIKPVIDMNLTLEQVREALDYSQSGRAEGRIVVTVKQSWSTQ